MGFQIFPEPVASAGGDDTTYGLFNKASAVGKKTPDEASITGLSFWYSTANIPAGYYQSQISDQASTTSGYGLFNGVQLTPSWTSPVTIRVATSGNDLKLVARTRWQSMGLGNLANVSTSQVKVFNVHNANTSPVFFAGMWDYRFVSPYNNPLAISTNGTSWTKTYLGWSNSDRIDTYGTAYKNGEHFVFTNNGIKSSTDLVNWTTVSTPSFGNPLGFIYDDITGRFYAASQNIDPTFRYSTNAINWTTGSWSPAAGGTTYGIKRVNDFLYSYGQGGGDWNGLPILRVSTNGINWQQAVIPSTSTSYWGAFDPTVYDVNYGNGFYWAVIGSGLGQTPSNQRDSILMSTDGLNFNLRYGITSGAGFASSIWDEENQMAVVFGMLTTSGSVVTSTNGITWTNRGLPNALSAGTTDGNAMGHVNFAHYVPGATGSNSKYFAVLHPLRANKNETTSLTTGRIRYAQSVAGSESSEFNMIVQRYNLSIDNSL